MPNYLTLPQKLVLWYYNIKLKLKESTPAAKLAIA